MQIVKEEFNRFLQLTSLRGVASIVRSTSIFSRLFWTFVIIVLFVLSVFHCLTLITLFASFSLNTVMEEKVYSPETFDVNLPVAVVCNNHPFQEESEWPPDVPKPGEFANTVDKVFACNDSCTEHEDQVYSDIREAIKSPSGYIQNVQLAKIQKISIRKAEFIIDCKVLVYGTNGISKSPCMDKVIIQEVLYEDRFQCFEIMANKSETRQQGGTIRGLQFIFYLNVKVPFLEETPDRGLGIHRGLYLAFSQYHSKIAAESPPTSQTISAGTHATFNFRVTHRKRLSPPHGNCVNHGPALGHDAWRCVDINIGHDILTNCNCTEPISPIENDLNPNVPPYCLNMTLGVDKVLQNFLCRQRVVADHFATSYLNCGMACDELYFDTDAHNFLWPKKTEYETIYANLVLGKPFQSRFSDLGKLLHHNCTDSECEILLNRASRIFESNFVKVTYLVGDKFYFEVQDVPKLTSYELFSQIGGALNLWSGITIVVLVELLESVSRMIYRLFKQKDLRQSKSRNQQQSVDHWVTWI